MWLWLNIVKKRINKIQRIIKSIDPEIQESYIEDSDAEERLDGGIWDTVLSGNYVVASVVHNFEAE